jgi:hypothetical protein
MLTATIVILEQTYSKLIHYIEHTNKHRAFSARLKISVNDTRKNTEIYTKGETNVKYWVSQKRDQAIFLMHDVKKKRNNKTLCQSILSFINSSYILCSFDHFSLFFTPDMESFNMNKTLGRARAEEDTSLPHDNGHWQYLCVIDRFAVCNHFISSCCLNNVIPDTVQHSSYRKVKIFTLTLNKKAYARTQSWVTANTHRTTGWDQETNVWREYIVREKYDLTYLKVLFSSFHVQSG